MSLRAVVVEDSEANRYLQSTWLRRAGFDVVEVATGGEALACVDERVDLVVLDVHLPDMSGFEVCATLRARPATAAVPVMHVSATLVDLHSRIEGLEHGADAYLVEPVDRGEFLATARSLARARVARRAAEQLSRRLALLVAATVPVNAAETVARLVEAAAQGAAEVFAVPALAVAQTETGLTVRAVCAGVDREPVSQTYGTVLSHPWTSDVHHADTAELPSPWPSLLARAGVTAARWTVCPVRAESGATLVGMAIAMPAGSGAGSGAGSDTAADGGAAPSAEGDAALLDQLARSVAVALARLQAFSQEHHVALTLQNALLPELLPDLPGLQLTARYNASSEGVSVGGDFYDAFVLPSGRLVVAIGDVQGHSLQAAVRMAELRFSLRAFMVEHERPERVVELLNAVLLTYYPDMTATLVLLVVEPSLDRMQLVNAGHLPALLTGPHGTDWIDGDGVLLGVAGPPPAALDVPLHPGTGLVLVTDGLVERRHQPLSEGLDALRAIVAGAGPLDAEQLADLLVDRFDVGGAADDVAVVVMRRP